MTTRWWLDGVCLGAQGHVVVFGRRMCRSFVGVGHEGGGGGFGQAGDDVAGGESGDDGTCRIFEGGSQGERWIASDQSYVRAAR